MGYAHLELKSKNLEQRLAHYFCRKRASAQAFEQHFPAGSHCQWSQLRATLMLASFV